MTQISNVDQVLLLLRERLARSAADNRTSTKAGADRAARTTAPPLDRVRALAAMDTLDPDELRRAVVRGVLAQEFGDAVGNDPRLHAIVEDVSRVIREMPGGKELIDRAVAQLRGEQPLP